MASLADTDSGPLRIERRGGSSGYRCLLFVGDTHQLTTSRDVVKQLGLEVGDMVDLGELATRILDAEPDSAKQRALRLLNHRERSRQELFRKLTEDGYSELCIVSVLDRLEEVELVDDARYTSAFIRTKIATGWGLRRIRKDLERAGIPEETISYALDDESIPDDRSRAHEAASRTRVRDASDARRLMSKLVRRGFSLEDARSAAFSRLPDGADDSKASI